MNYGILIQNNYIVGLPPPPYTLVKDVEKCIASHKAHPGDTYTEVCLLNTEDCPTESWEELLEISMNGGIAICSNEP